MNFEDLFRPAKREDVGLWINLIGGTGSGKTYSALRLAAGICGGEKFALIDAENRRAKHYADAFNFHHSDLRAPFTPEHYLERIKAADEHGCKAIVIDSTSHEWAGDGGILDMQEAEIDAMVDRALKKNPNREDWQVREAMKMASWIKPKAAHKKFITGLLNVRAHLIICLRAEEKITMEKNPETGKMEIVQKKSLTGRDGWIPICEKNLPFEATASFLFLRSNPGVPVPIKLQEQHKAIFPDGVEIDEEAGRRMAEWARGPQRVAGVEYISDAQMQGIAADLRAHGIPLSALLTKAAVSALDLILAGDVARSEAWVKAAIAKRQAAAAAATTNVTTPEQKNGNGHGAPTATEVENKINAAGNADQLVDALALIHKELPQADQDRLRQLARSREDDLFGGKP